MNATRELSERLEVYRTYRDALEARMRGQCAEPPSSIELGAWLVSYTLPLTFYMAVSDLIRATEDALKRADQT